MNVKDSDNGKPASNSVAGDNGASGPANSASKSPLRSRKSSLSAVIDKLRLQHNPDVDMFQGGNYLFKRLQDQFCASFKV